MDDQNYDIGIDEAKAQIWIIEVNNEVSSVRQVLDRIGKANSDKPANGDTILEGTDRLGKLMCNLFTHVCDVFEGADKMVEDLIKDVGKTGQSVTDMVSEFSAKFVR